MFDKIGKWFRRVRDSGAFWRYTRYAIYIASWILFIVGLLLRFLLPGHYNWYLAFCVIGGLSWVITWRTTSNPRWRNQYSNRPRSSKSNKNSGSINNDSAKSLAPDDNSFNPDQKQSAKDIVNQDPPVGSGSDQNDINN